MQCLPIAAPRPMGVAWPWPCGAVPDQSNGGQNGIRAHMHPVQAWGRRAETNHREHLGKFEERERRGRVWRAHEDHQRGRRHERHLCRSNRGFSNCIVQRSYLGPCQKSTSALVGLALGLRGRTSSKLSGDAADAGPGTVLWVARVYCKKQTKTLKKIPSLFCLTFLKTRTGHLSRN